MKPTGWRRHIRNGNIFYAVASLLVMLGVWVWQDQASVARQYDKVGITVVARVESLDRYVRQEYRNGVYRETSPSYSATVSYSSGSAVDGTLQIHRETNPVSGGFYMRTPLGAQIKVRYLPDDPTQVEIEKGWTAQNGIYALYACLGLAALFVLLGVLFGNMARAAHRLRTMGQPAKGTLKRIYPVLKLAVLEFTFTAPNGKTIKARSEPNQKWVNCGLKPGAPLDIVFDPKSPKNARLAMDIRR